MPQQIKQSIMSRFPTARWERWLIENRRKVCYHFMEYYAGRENHTMIYVKRTHLDRYLGLCPALDTAIRHLAQADLSALPPAATRWTETRSTSTVWTMPPFPRSRPHGRAMPATATSTS